MEVQNHQSVRWITDTCPWLGTGTTNWRSTQQDVGGATFGGQDVQYSIAHKGNLRIALVALKISKVRFSPIEQGRFEDHRQVLVHKAIAMFFIDTSLAML